MEVESSPDAYMGSVAGGHQKAGERTAATSDVSITLSSSSVLAFFGASSIRNEVFYAEKVECIKQAIANGSFQVNAGVIADKMLFDAAEMFCSNPDGARV